MNVVTEENLGRELLELVRDLRAILASVTSAIEARRAETLGSVEDESAAPKADAHD